MSAQRWILTVDTGSPVVSVAVGSAGEIAAARSVSQVQSADRLLALLAEALATAGIAVGGLAGLVAMQGPGSFTGLRVGLATVLGLHQATGIAATALPTLEVLAWEPGIATGSTVVSAVDARRGEWFVQSFRAGVPPLPGGGPELLRPEQLARRAPCTIVGFGASALPEAPGLVKREPTPLALLALRRLEAAVSWDPGRLSAPLYLRQAAADASPRPGGAVTGRADPSPWRRWSRP